MVNLELNTAEMLNCWKPEPDCHTHTEKLEINRQSLRTISLLIATHLPATHRRTVRKLLKLEENLTAA